MSLLESFFEATEGLFPTFVFDSSGSLKRVFNREITGKELQQIISS